MDTMTNTTPTPSNPRYDTLRRSTSDPTLDHSNHDTVTKTTTTNNDDKVSPLISQPTTTTFTPTDLRSTSSHSNDNISVATNTTSVLSDANGKPGSTTTAADGSRKFKCVFWPESKSLFGHHVKGTLVVSPTTLSFTGKHFDRVSLSFHPSTISKVEKHNAGLKSGIRITKIITGRMNSVDSGKGTASVADGTERVYFFTFSSQRGVAAAYISMMASEAKKAVGGAEESKPRQIVTKKVTMDTTSTTTVTSAEGAAPPPSSPAVAAPSTPPPPDATLSRMDVIISKKLSRVTVSRFYELVFSEGVETTAPPFYGPWLERRGSFDVDVGDWEFGRFRNEWCGEEYTQRRTVTFKFKRTSHTYLGPPVADVTHTHHLRVEGGNDRCVLAMTVNTAGIPFAETFNVEIRWVVTREEMETNLRIECGVFVNFLKSSILQGKIRSGTTVETTKTQNDHYANMEKTVALSLAAANGTPTEKPKGRNVTISSSSSPAKTKTMTIAKSGGGALTTTTTTAAITTPTNTTAVTTTTGGNVVRYSLVICSLLLLLWQFYGGDNTNFLTTMSPTTTATIEEMREMQNELRSLLLEIREEQNELKKLILLSKEDVEEEISRHNGDDDDEKKEMQTSVTDEKLILSKEDEEEEISRHNGDDDDDDDDEKKEMQTSVTDEM